VWAGASTRSHSIQRTMVTDNPAYVAAYQFAQMIVNLGFQVEYIFWPFLVMGLILRLVIWLRRISRGGYAGGIEDEYWALRETTMDFNSRRGRWWRNTRRWLDD